jgi:hypothetical protein
LFKNKEGKKFPQEKEKKMTARMTAQFILTKEGEMVINPDWTEAEQRREAELAKYYGYSLDSSEKHTETDTRPTEKKRMSASREAKLSGKK